MDGGLTGGQSPAALCSRLDRRQIYTIILSILRLFWVVCEQEGVISAQLGGGGRRVMGGGISVSSESKQWRQIKQEPASLLSQMLETRAQLRDESAGFVFTVARGDALQSAASIVKV